MKAIFIKSHSPVDGRERSRIDERATADAIRKLLESRKVAKVQGKWDDEKRYPFTVSAFYKGWQTETKQFRVYFQVRGALKSFIQSDVEGSLDDERLVVKAREMFADEQRYNDAERAKYEQREADDEHAELMTKKIKASGFEVESDYAGGFRVVARVFGRDELAKLIKKIK